MDAYRPEMKKNQDNQPTFQGKFNFMFSIWFTKNKMD